MNGSVFPYDIYWLLMSKYLNPHDALRMARTCKRLWRVFTSFEKKLLEAKMTGLQKHYLQKRSSLNCPACGVIVDSHNLHIHLRKDKCCFNIGRLKKVNCPHCGHMVKESRLDFHMGNTCEWLPWGLRKRACSDCGRYVLNNLCRNDCDICRQQSDCPRVCPKCPNYCFGCLQPCNGCMKYVSIRDSHICPSEQGRLAVVLGSHISRTFSFTDGSYRVEGQRIILVDTVCDIPPTFLDDTIVLQRETFQPILTVSGLLNIWHVAPEDVPHHCTVCINTERKTFSKCGKCGGPRYCSRSCQAMHWKVQHKYTCLD